MMFAGKKRRREKENIFCIFCNAYNTLSCLNEKRKTLTMYLLTEKEDFLCTEIVDCAYRVHRELGGGLLEKIYESCFCHELEKKEIPFKRQVSLPIFYDGLYFDEGLRIDVLVDNSIICELKAVENVNKLWEAQVLSHLKMTQLHVGFLINFNVSLIKDGIRRYCIQ